MCFCKSVFVLALAGFSLKVNGAPSLAHTKWKTPFITSPSGAQQDMCLDFQDEQNLLLTNRAFVNHPLFKSSIKFAMLFTYVLGEDQANLEQTSAIDLVLQKKFTTPLDELTASSFNKQLYCGFNDWVAGVVKDVTGLACKGSRGPHAAGDKNFNIVQVKDEHMLVGELGGRSDVGSTPEKRPTTLDQTKPFQQILSL